MAKEKKAEKEKDGQNGLLGAAVEDRVPEAWVGHNVKLRHPVNLNSSFAVGSSAGLLEEGERGGVLLKREQRYFYPWGSIFFISLDGRAGSPV